MIDAVIDLLSWALILAGSAFVVIGAVGLVRFPDLYTRMHAASIIDSLGSGLLLVGLMLQAGFTLVTLKLAFVLALLFFVGPATTHALAQAALHGGVKPKLHEGGGERRDRLAAAEPPRSGEPGR